MNWVHGDQHVELTDGTKGICISTYVYICSADLLAGVQSGPIKS